jgi:hypothetical protein
MKKSVLYLSIVLILGGVFSLAIQPNTVHKDNQIINSMLDVIGPTAAFADTDTVMRGPKPPPPPPPID